MPRLRESNLQHLWEWPPADQLIRDFNRNMWERNLKRRVFLGCESFYKQAKWPHLSKYSKKKQDQPDRYIWARRMADWSQVGWNSHCLICYHQIWHVLPEPALLMGTTWAELQSCSSPASPAWLTHFVFILHICLSFGFRDQTDVGGVGAHGHTVTWSLRAALLRVVIRLRGELAHRAAKGPVNHFQKIIGAYCVISENSQSASFDIQCTLKHNY